MKVNTFLPLFSGFYHSVYDLDINQEIEMIIEHHNEENNTELLYSDFNFKIDYKRYSEAIYEGIMEHIIKELPGLVISHKYEELIQPKEYNFSTDSINIELEVDKQKLLQLIEENHELLNDKIKEKYTSCSGFISSYSNELNNWIWAIENEDESIKHKIGALIGMLCEDDFEEWTLTEWIHVYDYINWEVNEIKLTEHLDNIGLCGVANKLKNTIAEMEKVAEKDIAKAVKESEDVKKHFGEVIMYDSMSVEEKTEYNGAK